jgi:hypothetical protein
MNCRRAKQLLPEYQDGLLTGREAAEMTAHVRDCPACRRLHDALATFEGKVRRVAERHPAPPHDLISRVVDRWTAERAAGAAAWRRWLVPPPAPLSSPAMIGAAAALLLLGLARWEFGRRTGFSASRIAQRVVQEPLGPAQHSAPPPQASHNGNRIARGIPVSPSPRERGTAYSTTLSGSAVANESGGSQTHADDPSSHTPVVDDLAAMNRSPEAAMRQWVPLRQEEWSRIEAQMRREVRVGDDFVQIPFPRLVSTSDRQIAATAESYKREAAIVDPRLAHEVTCAFKATALSDLCDQLRADTGIDLRAGPSVADDKVTQFCEKMPLRDVMRQLSRPFGYTWLRSGKPGEYRYELAQDLRSQLLEEELRNQDRNAALLAVDQEMQRYRPYLGLSPEEARARLATATPVEKPLLEHLARAGWGPVKMYFRLSPRDQDALRAGRRITFRAVPEPGEQPLPPDLERGVLQTMDTHRILLREGRYQSARAEYLPQGLPPAAVPEARASVAMDLFASELGQFMLGGYSGFTLPGGEGPTRGDSLATGMSPAVTKPRNEVANARWSRDPALQAVVTIEPKHFCSSSPPHSKATAADVLEALHRATGLPIVADAYTRLHLLEQVTVRVRPLFAALNQVSDTMRLRWNRDGEWLQFRSASYFHDRLKEVPNRLLARLVAARREQKVLSLDNLLEIAQFPDAQLDANSMAEGARECYGLAEWDLVRSPLIRSHLRLIAELSPSLRQQTQSTEGLPFSRLSLSQQQRVLPLMLGGLALERIRSLEELTGTVIRVDYATPGGFRWSAADNPGMDPWVLLPRLFARAPTRAGALQAARRIDPMAGGAQIIPTEPALAVIYLLDRRTGLSPAVIRSWSGGVRFTGARPLPPEVLNQPATGP